jgi:chemotaxis protein CheD
MKHEISVKVADQAVASGGETLVTLGLGSCVAIALYDPAARVGGLAHVLLPEPSISRDASNPAKFATTAVPMLIERMREMGARRARLEARLVGGASMFGNLLTSASFNMGERNVLAARAALAAAGVPIRGEEVGGERGRSVRFHLADGRVVVSSVASEPIVL